MKIIDQIRKKASIIKVVSQYTKLRKRGEKYIGLCPFHAEKNPSFTVDSEKGLFHCFGCGIGGDIFSFIMIKENISFTKTCKYLCREYGISLVGHWMSEIDG